MWKDYKYLIAYTLPLASYLSLYALGIWSFGGIYMAFGLLPLLDALAPQSEENFAAEEERSRLATRFFDLLLYLNLPILYGLIYYYFSTVAAGGLATYELVGITLSTGLVVGTIGINVAHELGHRVEKTEQLMAKAMLLSALYTHFFIEHNRGHHKHVATDEDPASARLNEPIYAFWLRSVTGSYRNAWRLERERLEKQGRPYWSWQNEMVRFTLAQALYLLAVGLAFGWAMIGYAAAIAVVGFLLLESVNYIEHYGLRRKKLDNGNYERVSPQHSWNSDHELGRIFLYELTRHSDHHYKATRKYQVLRHFDHSPQMPMGYPAAILLSLLPPLWFRVMNGRARAVGMTSHLVSKQT